MELRTGAPPDTDIVLAVEELVSLFASLIGNNSIDDGLPIISASTARPAKASESFGMRREGVITPLRSGLYVGTWRCDLPQALKISWMFLDICLGSFECAVNADANGDEVNIQNSRDFIHG